MPGGPRGSVFPPNLTGPFARNRRLQAAVRLFEGKILGSESVAVTPGGELIMLDKFGYVHRARPSAQDPEAFELATAPPLYIGPGRPLGFHSVEDGVALVVCDSLKGLIRVDMASGAVRILANRVTATGKPFHYANDLDVARNGTVYFSSSTAGIVQHNPAGFYDTMRSYLLNAFRGDAGGQLLAFDPATNEVRVLLGGIAYANGVALSADETFVLVVETTTCRVLRHWLAGPRQGTTDVFIDRLPGYPDGITRSADGGFWLTLVVPLTPVQWFLRAHRHVRQLLSHSAVPLCGYLARPWGCAVRLSPTGEPVEVLMDPDGSHVSTVSAVTEHQGRLFLGNLGGDFVSVLKL